MSAILFAKLDRIKTDIKQLENMFKDTALFYDIRMSLPEDCGKDAILCWPVKEKRLYFMSPEIVRPLCECPASTRIAVYPYLAGFIEEVEKEIFRMIDTIQIAHHSSILDLKIKTFKNNGIQ